MNIQEFKHNWEQKKDVDGTNAVGIDINWSKIIPDNGEIKQYYGQSAWKQIGSYYAPVWGSFKRTKMGVWLDIKRPDYQQFINEEEGVGKIDLYRKSGLIYPEFCTFADKKTGVGVMGDGCHRYIDCNYLILVEKMDFSKTISKCRLDVLLVNNLLEVLNNPKDYPPEFIINYK